MTSTGISIEPLPASEVAQHARQMVGVYTAAFAQPPYREPAEAGQRFARSLETHAGRDGFRMQVARAPGGEIVGFGYGYTSAPGQWWHDRAAAAVGPDLAAGRLAGAFEVVELAVAPEWHGRGIGSRLHDALLAGLPHRAAVLGVVDADIPARRLYRNRGWQPIARLPSTSAGPYLIMALDLPPRDPVGSAP